MRVWAGLVGVSKRMKCVSRGPGAGLVRDWRGFGTGLGGFGASMELVLCGQVHIW